MAEKSRIRFNPVSGEIEIEGTERFVKTYFGKVQKLLADSSGGMVKGAAPRNKAGIKAAKTSAAKSSGKKPGGKRDRKGNIFNTVVKFITEGKGINTAELLKKTGLNKQQVRSVIYRAEKQGRIRKAGRGIYTAA